MSTPASIISGSTGHVVVKFRRGAAPPYDSDDAVMRDLRLRFPDAWQAFGPGFGNIRIRRMFTAVPRVRIEEILRDAERQSPGYRAPDLLSYFVVDLQPSFDVEELIRLLRREFPLSLAYFDPPGADPAGGDNPYYVSQGYLSPAPAGIDADFAWTVPGGNGAGQRFADVEQGWTKEHEDLKDQQIVPLHGTIQDSSRRHGTQTLGVVCAVDNDKGVIGIAHKVEKVGISSHYGSNRPDAMLAAIGWLPSSGVLLLEVQLPTFWDGTQNIQYVPIELEPADFDVIRLATALGITVVEAAGNGTLNLDNVTNADGKLVLRRGHEDFLDSGAVMVAAAQPNTSHARIATSNYGSRIDCFAWGAQIATTDSGTAYPYATDYYYFYFSETSGASAIVAGAALAVQGVRAASLHPPLSGLQMRGILSNPVTGTPSVSNEPIGVMPDLKGILKTMGLAPDLYLRDFVGDVGDPHTGMVSQSPDIFLLPAAVSNPQSAFGEGSGTENSNLLGHQVMAGQDNYVYMRARNRGGSDAGATKARVYWSPVSTLPLPDMWNLVGEASLASVPAANVLTVFNPITWPAAAIPASGHYCFVGVIGSSQDPAPPIPNQLEWQQFRRLIRDNNNLTWRNFNVVDIEPDASGVPAPFSPMRFIVPGPPDTDQRMTLEVRPSLPPGSIALLEVPIGLHESMTYPPTPTSDYEPPADDLVLIELNANGLPTAIEAVAAARARYRCRLLVNVPAAFRKDAYEIFVRQLQDGTELGRVTWRLEPDGQSLRALTRRIKG